MTDFRTVSNPELLPKVRSAVLRDAIRGMPCALRVSSFVPGRRCANPETVVGCHISGIGKGVATKVSDLFIAAGCTSCHDIVDGRDRAAADYITSHYPAAFEAQVRRAMMETMSRLVGLGVITVAGNQNEID